MEPEKVNNGQEAVPAAQPAAATPEATNTTAAPATQPAQAETTAAPQAAAPAATETAQAPATAPAAEPAQAAPATTEATQPAATPTQTVATAPAPTPQPLPQPAQEPAPQPQTVPQPTQKAVPTPTHVATAAPATEAVQDIKPSAPLNPLANEQTSTASGVGVIGPSNALNSYDSTNIGFVPVGEAMPKKKNKGLRALIILILLAGLGALGYFVIYPYVFRTYFANPKNVYDAVVKESFKKLSNTVTETAHTRSIYDVTFSFDSNIEALKDYIGYTYGINVGVDPEEKSLQTGIVLKDKDNIEHSYYTFIKDNKKYLRFSSYRELIYSGEADYDSASNILVSYNDLLDVSSKLDSSEINYLITKVGDLVAGSISAEKLLKEDASITINGEITKVLCNKYTINNQVLSDTFAYVRDGILKDEKALEIISNLTEQDISQVRRSLEDADTTVKILESDEEIVISIFTYGLKNEIVGYELSDNKNDGNVHLYMKDGFFEFKSHALVNDEETGKENETNIFIVGNKVEGKTKIGIKYNDEDVAALVINTWNDNMKDVDYDIKYNDTNYNGNIKFSKDVNKDRGKYNFELYVSVGKEYIKFNMNAENTWNAEVANIMIGSAKTLSDDEITQKENDFIQTLQSTPFYKLFTTTDGTFDKSILDYYGTHKIEIPSPEPTVDNNGEDPQTQNIDNSLQDACFKLDASGSYSDEKTTCVNYVCSETINGEIRRKECNVA